jgi:hypothetical protein
MQTQILLLLAFTSTSGKILEDLDALAGNIAFNHVQGNAMIVTAGVDRIRVRERPEISADQFLSGKVTWVCNLSTSSYYHGNKLKSGGSSLLLLCNLRLSC